MPSVGNARWKRSTRDFSLLPFLSWRCLNVTNFQPARPSRADLAALTEAPVEALRTLFLDDLLSRPLSSDSTEKQIGGLTDRAGNTWVVFDLDGTREAARVSCLAPDRRPAPSPIDRLNEVCAPGYTGRKRGQVVRTRTVISQAHTFQWLGTFGNRGNGR